MEARGTATEILKTVESMVDPNAPVEQQLAQMREQMAVLAELPKLINQKLELVNKQINQISIQKESTEKVVVQELKEQRQIKSVEMKKQTETQQPHQYYQKQFQKHNEEQNEKRKQQQLKQQQMQQQQRKENNVHPKHSVEITALMEPDVEPSIQIRVTKPSLTGEDLDAVQREELRKSLEDLRMRKSVSPANDKASQTSQGRPARGKPEPAFGPAPVERPLYLPGGKRWKISEYDEDQITETLVGQAEVIKGHAMGVNFKKFEKPPPGLDHLKHSEVYRAVHNLEDAPLKKVQMFRPTAFAESEIRERVRSMSPANPAESR